MDILQVLALASTVNERFIEYIFAPLFAKVPALQPYAWTQIYLQLLSGVGAAMLFHLNFASAVIPDFPLVPLAGQVVTGLVIGGGSEIFHQVVGGLKALKTSLSPAAPVVDEGVG